MNETLSPKNWPKNARCLDLCTISRGGKSPQREEEEEEKEEENPNEPPTQRTPTNPNGGSPDGPLVFPMLPPLREPFFNGGKETTLRQARLPPHCTALPHARLMHAACILRVCAHSNAAVSDGDGEVELVRQLPRIQDLHAESSAM